MKAKEFKKRCEALTGVSGHGWQAAAASALGVSDRTLRNVLKSDSVSTALHSKLVLAENSAKEVKECDWQPLALEAGRWAVGFPETKSPDKGVIGECVVTHLSSPMFVVHVVAKNGKASDGTQNMERRVRWLEEPSTEKRKEDLLKQAFEKAERHVFHHAGALAESKARENLQKKAVEAGMDPEDARSSTAAQLSNAYRYRDTETLKTMIGELNREISAYSEFCDARENDGLFDKASLRAQKSDAEYIGKLKALYSYSVLAEAHAGEDIARLIVSKLLSTIPSARKGSVRAKLAG